MPSDLNSSHLTTFSLASTIFLPKLTILTRNDFTALTPHSVTSHPEALLALLLFVLVFVLLWVVSLAHNSKLQHKRSEERQQRRTQLLVAAEQQRKKQKRMGVGAGDGVVVIDPEAANGGGGGSSAAVSGAEEEEEANERLEAAQALADAEAAEPWRAVGSGEEESHEHPKHMYPKRLQLHLKHNLMNRHGMSAATACCLLLPADACACLFVRCA